MRRFTALLLALGIIALLAWNSGGFFFVRPYYEYWDSAANSLFILKAKHFAQLYGPYSRYLFNHPGPAFFYTYAFGEWLFFDVLHVVPSPVQGQLLINLCLVTGFYVAALNIFAHWLPTQRRWGFLWAALLFGIVHFSLMKNFPSYDVLDSPSAFLSLWSGHSVVMPFLCLLIAGASIGAGRGGDLPLLILAGGYLMEHVSEPIFVGPTAVVAYGGLVAYCAARERDGGGPPGPGKPRRGAWPLAAWRAHPRAHLAAGVILFIFLLPMLIDLCWGRESNFAAILRHLHEGSRDRKSLTRAVTFFLLFGAYAPYQPHRIDFGHYDLPGYLAYLRAHALLYAGWLVVFALVLRAPFAYVRGLTRRRVIVSGAANPEEGTRRFLGWAALMTFLNIALSLYWGTKQDGLMYYYLSWSNFAIYYCAALVAVAVFLTRRSVPETAHGGRWPLARLAGVGVLIFAGYLFADRLRIHEYDPDGMRAMHASVERAIAASDASHPGACKVLIMPDEHWPMAIAAGLQLARAGEPFVVSAGRWKNVFDAHYLWQSQRGKALEKGLCPWYVITAGATRPGVPSDAPTYPLTNGAELMLTPPTLELSTPGSAVDFHFVANGNAGDFVLAGWAVPEGFGTWNEAPWAALAFRPQVVQGTYVELRLTGVPFLSPVHGLTLQRVRLFFNGTPVGPEQQLTAAGTLRFSLPAAVWNGAASKPDALASLAFEFPDAVSPSVLDAKAAGDPRVLGVFFQQVSLRVTGYPAVESALARSAANDHAAYKILVAPEKYRAEAVEVGAQLARDGVASVMPDRWKEAFGATRDWPTLNADVLKHGVSPWYIVPADVPRRGVPPDAPAFPLGHGVQLSLTPPTLALPDPGRAADFRFVTDGNASDLVLAGWAAPESFGTWSEQPWTALAFRPQVVPGTSVEVVVEGIPYLSPEHGLTHQRVNLFFNGEPVGTGQQLSSAGAMTFSIPAATWNAAARKTDAPASLAFEFPDAVAPARLDPHQPNGDPRNLGIFFQRMHFRVVP